MNKNSIAFEIGTEELPALELHSATKQVEHFVNALKGKLFDFDNAMVYSTPRRIIICIDGVPEKIEASVEEYKGPKTEIAFQDGQPTKAAIGFARGKALNAEDLEIRNIDGQDYVFAVKNIPEKNIADMLPKLFLDLIKNIKWKRTQRWGDVSDQFARPIRWIFAMFGESVFNVEYAGVRSSNITYGHRFLSPSPIKLSNASELIDALAKSYVVLSEDQREASIKEQVKSIEVDTNLKCELNPSTLQEVVNLCEFPTAMVGEFDEQFLEVPKEIIVDAMLVHQRYFPLFDDAGKLTNKFVIVSNGDPACKNTIVDGNQRVVAARLYDAKFFFEEDKKIPLEEYFDKLDDVVFQEQLGTMKQKAKRIETLSHKIASLAGLDIDMQDKSARAGKLAKCDLVTNAVIEFTSVQGIMGQYYAEASGEDELVSIAIGQHYKPKFSGDSIPENKIGMCVAAADKIDTLCGMFAINMLPTGSSDPFALRRGAIGILSIIQNGINFSLVSAIKASLKMYSEYIDFKFDEAYNAVIEFILTRAKVMLKDDGFSHDTIEAIANANVEEPLSFIERVKVLEHARKQNFETFEDLATAFARANNLTDKKVGCDFSQDNLLPVEKNLIDATQEAEAAIKGALEKHDYETCVAALANLRKPIDDFFDKVMVKDENLQIRENRFKILNDFVSVFSNVADFGKISKKNIS